MRLTEILTSGDQTIAKDASGQLYVGSIDPKVDLADAPRHFAKIDSYELRYDSEGNSELVNTVYSFDKF